LKVLHDRICESKFIQNIYFLLQLQRELLRYRLPVIQVVHVFAVFVQIDIATSVSSDPRISRNPWRHFPCRGPGIAWHSDLFIL